jgi:uncharacterized protein (TIGR03067 family)
LNRSHNPIRENAMKVKGLVVLTAVILVAAEDKGKKDQDKIQGVWETTAVELNGKDLAADGVKLTFTIKGDKATVEGNEEAKRDYSGFTFKLDSTTNPKCIDMKVTAGDQKDTDLEGIYEFKGEELRLCIKLGAKERPAKFASPEGQNIALLTLKRIKP